MTSVLHELIAKTKIAAGNATVGIVDDDHGMKSAMVCVGLGLAALAEAVSQTGTKPPMYEANPVGRHVPAGAPNPTDEWASQIVHDAEAADRQAQAEEAERSGRGRAA